MRIGKVFSFYFGIVFFLRNLIKYLLRKKILKMLNRKLQIVLYNNLQKKSQSQNKIKKTATKTEIEPYA